MTTISTRSTLSTSLARTKGGCANEAHHSNSKEHRRSERLRRDESDDDGGIDVDVFVDEEIDSDEADGVEEAPPSGDIDTTKHELKAALVSSIVDSAAPGKESSDTKELDIQSAKPNKQESDTVTTLGKRKTLTDGQEVQIDDVVSKLPCEDDSPHVTPPASASSSFSSVEPAETNRITSPSTTAAASSEEQSKSSSPTGGRTMYQRASKSVATEKVASVLVPALKPNPKLTSTIANENETQGSSLSSSDTKKRRLDTDITTSSTPTAAPGAPLACPAPGKAMLNGRTIVPTPVTKGGAKQTKSPKTLTAQAKLAQGAAPRSHAPIYAGGMKPVPNPLASKEDTPVRTLEPAKHSEPPNPNASTPNTSNKSSRSRTSSVTKKTKTLMSAAPNAVVPSSGPPSRNLSSAQLDTVVPPVQPQEAVSAVGVNPDSRGRIFSIDLDPSVLDFVGSVVDDHNNDKNVSFKGDVADNAMSDTFRRDRGFSFEFFSFGIDANEDLPPVPDGMLPSGSRLRGDSIIYDPTSFCDGGIHEASALMHTTKHEPSADTVPSQQAPSAVSSSTQQGKAVQILRPTSSGRRPKPSLKLQAAAAANTVPAQEVGKGGSVPPVQMKQSTRGVKLSHSPIKYTKTTSKSSQGGTTTRTTNASRPIPQALTENTIHMPHGSDAAAAAAAGLPANVDASQGGDGFSLSHTACPMDLLNKGGRIGIYLPEERKARIAKFHSKRRSRIWRKRIKYDCRKKLADSRPRIKGRFVKRSDVDGEDSP